MGKFKVWDNRDKEWDNRNIFFIGKCGNLFKVSIGQIKLALPYFTPVHSTGKTDKNGVELFDGDIVKASIYEGEDEQILEIQCRNNVFVIDYDDGDIDCFLVVDFPGIIEKIGKKFENTELLDTK